MTVTLKIAVTSATVDGPRKFRGPNFCTGLVAAALPPMDLLPGCSQRDYRFRISIFNGACATILVVFISNAVFLQVVARIGKI